MKSFVFITDLHFTNRATFRVGDPLADILAKVAFAVDYANKADAQLLLGGDIYDSAVVPYEVSTAAMLAFRKAKYTPIVVKGNHDQMFRNDSYDPKTALYTGIRLGVFQELTQPLDFGDCVLTSLKTPPATEKPCIFMFHGFLNTKDGKHTVMSEELRAFPMQTFALLGHDHMEYDPLQLGNTTVYRIGSIFRKERTAASDRSPKLLHIVATPDGLSANLVTIPAKPVTEVFRETAAQAATEVEVSVDYASLLDELKAISTEDADLEMLIGSVASPAVGEYLLSLLAQTKLKQTK